MTRRVVIGRAILAAAITVALASGAAAQSRPRVGAQPLEVHGFADLGVTVFTARESFKTVLGSSTGIIFGGGGGLVLPQQVFVDVRASRFKKDGKRVVATDAGVFDLGITNTITISPIDLTVGYRFGRRQDRLRPYAGGGISWYRYEETDQFASGSEVVNDTFTGFHLLGGAEYRVHQYVGIAGEAAWARVPDALGQSTSVGATYGESDLGGTTLRVKVVIGR